MNTPERPAPSGLIAAMVDRFLGSQLAVLFTLFALLVGAAAVVITPREEDPQIVVPLADVFVHYPGASAEEVEKLVATPLERLLWQIDGVEYVYSMSRRDLAVVTVRFFVGQDLVQSLVRLHNKISMNVDRVPAGVTGWVVKPVEIDDVSIVNLTLYSDAHDDHQLRRIGEELMARLESLEDLSRTEIVGGRKRELRVELDPERLAGYAVTAPEVLRALTGVDISRTLGTLTRDNRDRPVSSEAFLTSAPDAATLTVAVHDGRPVRLQDLAVIRDGPEEPVRYSRIGFSLRYLTEQGIEPGGGSLPAVTLALAKKRGTNAVDVAEAVIERVEQLKRTVLPAGVRVVVTRNAGATASRKVDDLLLSLAFAIVCVVGLIAFSMGWREGLVVAFSVPVTFALSLFVNYLAGYTINRVTLFALILSMGLVVDDPIINVDNIQRHILGGRESPRQSTLRAVQEVLPPVILSTLAIIVSFGPMFFITGMMGPYMAPMAVNVPLAVTFSTLSALTVVPWLSYRLLRGLRPRQGDPANADPGPGTEPGPSRMKRAYRQLLTPFLDSGRLSRLLILATVGLLLVSVALVLLRLVPLKMLPFDNKNEFQIVLDLDEGATLEQTDRVVRAFEAYLETVPEVDHFVTYSGTASPMDFNGLVRHYYLRSEPHQADIRVNLAPKERRRRQSHEILLRIRSDLQAIAQRHQAALKLVETPPGPPVIATLTAELHAPADRGYAQLIEAAGSLRQMMATEPLVVDLDDTVEAARTRVDFVVDKEKSALHGVSPAALIETLGLALGGATARSLHLAGERQQLPIRLTVPRTDRTSPADLARLPVKTAAGRLVSLGELGRFQETPVDQPIYHKNLERLVYVFADTAGRPPAEAVLDLEARLEREPLPHGARAVWTGEGEWHITIRVFRDLGIAFGAALLGIYLLLIVQTGSYSIPLIIMTAIPLTLIGILPGFWLLNLVAAEPIGGYPNPIYFTATSMIGMIALGGIVVRNSIVLIEFIDDSRRHGTPFREAVLNSGVVRLRPILLTAATTALGAWPITLDPIFSGLAWALIFGLLASTAFTLIIVPVIYYQLYRRRFEAGTDHDSPRPA